MNAETIRSRIVENMPDAQVTVTTVSAEESKYDVQVFSDTFKGVPLIQRHRRINDLFKEELLSSAIHALTIKAAPLPQPVS